MQNLKDSIKAINDIIYDFSCATELATVLVDVRGNEISPRVNFSEFCNKIRSNKEYLNVCINCDRLGGANSLKENKAFCYTCHAGLVDFSVPIIKKGNLLGFIQCGQVKVKNNVISNIEHFSRDISRQDNELKVLHGQIKTVSLNKMLSSAKMISRLLGNEILDIIDDVDDEYLLGCNEIVTIKQYKYQYQIDEAISFVNKNMRHNVSLEMVSSYVNLSPYYFCRIFKKLMGVGFNQYVNHQRILKANSLLSESPLSIDDIAKAVGFGSSSYFIKQFKHHHEITPCEYRESTKKLHVGVG